MLNISLVTGHPSDKVVTFIVDHDFLGPYEKIAIPKGSRLEQYSPLAQSFFERGGDLNRVDFFARDGETSISIARKLLAWNQKGRDLATELVRDFFERRNVPPVFIEALPKEFKAHPAFDHQGHPVKEMVQTAFFDQVNPLLASDGGAMELLNVEVKPNGEIYGDIALLGSCNSCTSAQDVTLKKASEKINEVLNVVKGKYPTNPSVSSLDFKGMRIKNLEEIILAKP